MPRQHRELAAGRWFTLSLAEQLGNIGSEVGRAISWREKGSGERAEHAAARALELLDLTLADERWRGPKRREIARVREAWCDAFFGEERTSAALSSWDAYFMPFAAMARARRKI
jgi:hypothetical protein